MSSTPSIREAFGEFASTTKESFLDFMEKVIESADDVRVRAMLARRTKLQEALGDLEKEIEESALEELRDGKFTFEEVVDRYHISASLLDEWIHQDEMKKERDAAHDTGSAG